MISSTRKKGIYRIVDLFFRFWYRFVPGNLLSIVSGTIRRSYKTSIENYFPDYMGLVFEDIYREYLRSYARDLPFEICEIGEWWGAHPTLKKEVQIDIVATAKRENNQTGGRKFIIGSCKYRNEMVDIDELELITDYASVFTNANDTCFYYIFSKSGFTDRLKQAQENGLVRLVSLEELYSVG